MRKSLKIILSISLFIFIVAIFVAMYFVIFKEEDLIDKFEMTNDSIVLEVGDSFDLNNCFNVSPKSSEILVMCFVTDATYADISGNNIILAKSVGETKILVRCKVKGKRIENEIDVTIIDKIVLPTSFSFEKSNIIIGLNTSSCINRIVSSSVYNATGVVTYSSNNICEYNVLTGEIIPLNYGETVVTVTFSKGNDAISNSFTVKIQDNYRIISTELTKENEYYILNVDINAISRLALIVKENSIETSSVKLKYTILSNEDKIDYITLESNLLKVRMIENGEVILKIYCEDDESVFILIKVKAV